MFVNENFNCLYSIWNHVNTSLYFMHYTQFLSGSMNNPNLKHFPDLDTSYINRIYINVSHR